MMDAVRFRPIADSKCKRCVEFSARLTTSVDDLRQKAHGCFSSVSSSDFGGYLLSSEDELRGSRFNIPYDTRP